MLEEEERPGLRNHLTVLRRRKWTAILTVGVLVAVSLLFSFLQTPVYKGTARVLLQPASTDKLFNANTGQSNDPARAVETQIQVITSEPVKAAVRQQLGNAPTVSATGVGQTDVIDVSAQSPNPDMAAKAATAYANAYIDFSRKKAVDDLLAASQQIKSRVDDLQSQIKDLDAQVDQAPPLQQAGVRETVAAQKVALIQQQSTFKERLGQVQVDANLSTGKAQLVAPASTPTSPVKPTPVRTAILALVVGLVLGVGLAFLSEHLDDSVKTKDDLDRAGGRLSVMGVIPAVSGWKAKEEPRVVSLTEPRSAPAEAYRTLRTAIRFVAIDRPLRTLMITSPGAQEGKSTTIANLGVALAAMGRRVVIVCCDLRCPRIHEFFDLANDVGLTSVLLDDTPLRAAVQAVPAQPNLHLLASGPLPPNPADVLSSARVTDIFETLSDLSDIVLIDSPPVLPVTDSLVLAARVDGMLLTCRAGETTRKEVVRANELLQQVDAPLIGSVLIGVSEGETDGYYYKEYRPRFGSEKTVANGHDKVRRPTSSAPTSSAP